MRVSLLSRKGICELQTAVAKASRLQNSRLPGKRLQRGCASSNPILNNWKKQESLDWWADICNMSNYIGETYEGDQMREKISFFALLAQLIYPYWSLSAILLITLLRTNRLLLMNPPSFKRTPEQIHWYEKDQLTGNFDIACVPKMTQKAPLWFKPHKLVILDQVQDQGKGKQNTERTSLKFKIQLLFCCPLLACALKCAVPDLEFLKVYVGKFSFRVKHSIFLGSRNLWRQTVHTMVLIPSAPVADALSDPAKSTKFYRTRRQNM